MLEVAVRAKLLATAEVTGYVGAGSKARIRPLKLAQMDALPGITYQRISAVYAEHSLGPNGLAFGRVQIDCYGEKTEDTTKAYLMAKRLGAAVRRALTPFHGTSGGVTVERCSISGDRDFYDEPRGVYGVSFDVEAWYQEETPSAV